MGTFHDDKGDLHGMTLAVRTADAVAVGRCDTVSADAIVLLDADVHAEGDDGRTNDEWLSRAARFGVAPRHPRVTLPLSDVEDYGLLADFYEGVGRSEAAAKPAAPAPAPAADADPDALVAITDAAAAEVRRILTDDPEAAGKGLRLGVAGGGCSGLVYKVEFDTPRDGDAVVNCDGFDVLLDPKSVIYLRGTTLDWQGGLEGRGFRFVNPNASNTCGCGESFSV